MEGCVSFEITVVTASVNRAGLARTVRSVQDQTLRPVRHCIVLQQLMREPAVQIPKPSVVPIYIQWLPPPQPNIIEAYNTADAMAETEWVAMLDDDCWWEPDHLENLMALAKQTRADFVWSSSILHDERTGREVSRRDDSTPAFQHIDTNEILFKRSCISRWGGFLLTDCDPSEFPKLRGIDGKRIERWVKGGAEYAHSPHFSCHYDMRPVPEF